MLTPRFIKHHIANHLDCLHLEVTGNNQHFTAIIVSNAFVDKNLIERHQLVYTILGTLMQKEIHALSLKTITPEEFNIS